MLSRIDYKRFSSFRSDAYKDTHLYLEVSRHRYIKPDRDYPYVCWTKPIHDLTTIKELARMWAEITAYYIRYGGSFPDIQEILERRGVL